MKIVQFKIKTKEGPYDVPAYNLGQGLFLHRSYQTTKDLRCKRKLNRKWRRWTISAANGYAIISMRIDEDGVSFRDIIRAARSLKKMDWTQSLRLHEMTTEELGAFMKNGGVMIKRFWKRLTCNGI